MPGYGSRYWADRTAANRRRSHPTLRGHHTADVVVIGGGLTGATAAYVLAAGGLDVVLVEANRVASGSTAGSLGVVVPEPDAWFREVEPLAGRRVSRIAWKEAHRSGAEFAGAIRKLDIKCDLAPAAYLINARVGEDAALLRREQAVRRAAGVTAAWVTPAAATAETGLESAGALGPGGAFTFDPVRAALGFVAAAERKGARVFERSAVRRTTFTRKDADVLLAGASIRTRGIVVATGEPGSVFGQLRRHVRRESGSVVVTEPLNAAMRREAGRRASIVAEASGVRRHWLRWLTEDRAMFAGAVTKPAPVRQRDRMLVQKTAQLMYELSVRYPVISGLPARWGWATEVVTTPDGLPWIGPHRNYPFHFFSMAFGWHGDGLAWLAARAALRHFTTTSRKDDEALSFARYLG
jgi:glycine/D-amino acid oxidase-like deaminating enzyme